MLIATTDVDFDYIKKHQMEPDSVVEYAESLVPSWAKHIRGIVDNQRYYVAVRVRNLLSIAYKPRKAITDALIKNVTLFGMLNDFVTVDELLDLCDKDKLTEALRREHENGKKA